jgi:hypothetical protein
MFVYGIFQNEKEAAAAVDALVNADFTADHISALMHEGSEVTELPAEQRTGIGRGAIIGAALGAIGGAILVPVSGLLAAGPLLAALEGAVAGGAAGTVLGGVMGLGHWHEEIDFVNHRLKEGAVIVGVETIPERREGAEAALRSAGAEDVHAQTKKSAVEEAKEL